MTIDRKPRVLEDAFVRLEPITLEHVEESLDAYEPGSLALSGWMGADPATPEHMRAFVAAAVRLMDAGERIVHVVRDVRAAGRLVRHTSFLDLVDEIPRVEIGATWYTPGARGTHVNPAAKRLLLAHAFESWGCEAVVLKTSHRNIRSQAAIAKLGATLDGRLRAHMRHPDGSLRTSFVYSILREEWPDVRARLDARLTRHVA